MRYNSKVSTLAQRKVSATYKKDRSAKGKIKSPTGSSSWVRPSDWLTMPTITETDQKIALLMPIYPQGSNFLAFTVTGAYTVNWGDGATENVAAGIKAQHQYSYADADLDPTVTSDGYKMAIVVITPQAGQNITSVDFNQKYALTGSIFSDASPILEIKFSCPNLTAFALGTNNSTTAFCKNLVNFSGINMGLLNTFLNLFGNLTSLENVSFDSISNITVTAQMFINCFSLTSVPLFNTASVTNMGNMFNTCRPLTSVPLFNTASVTNMGSMFNNCPALISVPLFNTASVTNMGSMFNNCVSLTSVPLFNTASVTNMNSMFDNCPALISVPLFNTASVTDMSDMFNSCRSLTSVPLFNTASVTSMNSMFSSCPALISVPLFNTASVTDMNSMFSSCRSLTSVPLFNTASVTSMNSMFITCVSLISVPLFNTASVRSMSDMFSFCTALISVPLFNTASVTNMNSMFSDCVSLTSVPLFNTASVTNMGSMFNNCPALISVPLLISGSGTTTTKFTGIFSSCVSLTRAALNGSEYSISYTGCKLSKEELESIFNNLDTIAAASQTVTVTNNWGAPTPIALTGTTTAGSTTITMANTTGIVVGMQITGTGSPLTTARAVTFTDVGDLVNLASHGLSNGDEVSLATITTTTGIIINKIYYVVNAAINTFQVATTLGGAARPLTSDGSGTLRYKTEVVSIKPDVSITVSRPMSSSGANSLIFRQLKTGIALIKGWVVTG
jgi:surface protein